MQKLVDYTLQELENLVAVAPYSQYHQMLLSLKRNELNKSTLYQPYLGSLPELKYFLKKEVNQINPLQKSEEIGSSDPHITAEKITQPVVNNLDEVEVRPVKTDTIKKKKKVKLQSKKQETKKKKKKINKSIDVAGLSGYSKWLLLGKKIEVKQKKQKSKIKSTKKATGDEHQGEKPEVISEPLAQLLALQGHTAKAIGMYEKLVKLFPEKEKEYLEQIDEIKK